jgi:hypothetical protein
MRQLMERSLFGFLFDRPPHFRFNLFESSATRRYFNLSNLRVVSVVVGPCSHGAIASSTVLVSCFPFLAMCMELAGLHVEFT